MRVILLAVVVVAIISITSGAESSQDDRVCDDESRVKLSILNGLRQEHVMKENRVHQFKKAIDEEKIKVAEAEKSLERMRKVANTTHNQARELLKILDNMTTTELEELEQDQICSEDGFLADCCQIKKLLPSASSGLYAIKDPCSGDTPFSYAKLAVYCDMETEGGGWILIQRRNASMGWVNFTRNISDYENGFGDIDGEFWIGLKNIYQLTNQQNMKLKMRVWDDNGYSQSWDYPLFKIYDKRSRYALLTSVTRGSGDGSYSAFANEGSGGIYFTTYDYSSSGNTCGFRRQSGWWYHGSSCGYANPNGRHKPSGLCGTDWDGERVVWRGSNGYRVYTYSEMKIRSVSCSLN